MFVSHPMISPQPYRTCLERNLADIKSFIRWIGFEKVGREEGVGESTHACRELMRERKRERGGEEEREKEGERGREREREKEGEIEGER